MVPGAGASAASRVPSRVHQEARFRDRLAALALDAALVLACVALVAQALARGGAYLPFEATFLLAAPLYAAAALAWKGRTIGKAACGLEVAGPDCARPGLARALFRESLGKALSALPLGLGFLAALGPGRRAWHDRLARTRVTRSAGASARARIVVPATLVVAALPALVWAGATVRLYLDVRGPSSAAATSPAPAGSPPPTEVRSLGPADEPAFALWLDRHGEDPLAYATRRSREHRVVIYGEMHWKKEPLRFLNELLPRLYADAGVTCVALEACLAADDAAIERLVNAETYDAELALRLARHHSSRSWGWKGYWDVFETAWRLNRSLPPGAPRLRVVGLDLALDLPSAALAGVGDDAVDGPWIERLRLVRVLPQLPRFLLRDAFMARQVERQILDRGERGIVWIGYAHTSVRRPSPGPVGSTRGRMGFLLRRKHGDAIFQVRVHDVDLPVTLSAPGYRGPPPAFAGFVERVAAAHGPGPVAFDVAGSPFEPLRDGGSWEYHFDPRSRLGDLADGYVFLAPAGALTRCDWLPGYVTERMFAADAPYFRARARRAGVEARNAAEADRALAGS